MRIGFDFDNTIVNYNYLFHKVALERNLIDHTIPVNKLAVRDFLRATDREPSWTEMQGYVYGARMHEAESYPNVIQVMERLRNAGHNIAIISHKTKSPYLGEPYDLHAASRAWIDVNLKDEDGMPLIPNEHIFFELTKEDKLQRIAHFACDLYIDDLPEILLASNFPTNTQRVLFDPEQHHQAERLDNIKIISSWNGFNEIVSS